MQPHADREDENDEASDSSIAGSPQRKTRQIDTTGLKQAKDATISLIQAHLKRFEYFGITPPSVDPWLDAAMERLARQEAAIERLRR